MVINNFINKKLSTLTKVRHDIRALKTIRDLMDYISFHQLELVAYGLLLLWIFSPLYAILSGVWLVFQTNRTFVADQYYYWYTLLLQIGYLGVFYGGLIQVKKKFANKLVRINATERARKIPWTPVLLLVLLGWSTASWVLSDNLALSFFGTPYRKDGLATYWAYCGMFILGYFMDNQHRIMKILYGYAVMASVLSTLVILDLTFINRVLSLNGTSSIFLNTNHFAYYLCLSILIIVTLMLCEDLNLRHLFLKSLFFAINIAALIKNQSLGPFLAVVAGLIFLLITVVVLTPKSTKKMLFILAVFVTVSSLCIALNQGIIYDVQQLNRDISTVYDAPHQADQAGSGRWELWVAAARYSYEKPLFGFGPDNLGARYNRDNIMKDRPHNEIIQIAASLGLPAAIMYVLAIGIHFSRLISRASITTNLSLGLYAVVFGYFLSSLVGNTMFYTTPYFFMILGMSVGVSDRLTHKEHLSIGRFYE